MRPLIGGSCVKFGDSVNTDLIMPGRYLVSIDPAELAEHVFEPLGPQVQARVRASKVVRIDLGKGASVRPAGGE